MITEQRARELRNIIETAMTSVSDEVALSAPELVPAFNSDGHSYTTGDKFTYDGVMYKVLQAHTSQSDWTPETAPSLYAKVLIPTDEEGQQTTIPDWEQPESTNGYMKGDKVRYNDKIYESLIDNNVWSPEAYPAGWSEVTS